ncbi:MAG: hypothetical protein ACJA0Z_002133, partial [Halioglobus sp.]
MKTSKIIDIALLVLLAAGFLGALKVSIANLTGSYCPQVWIIPICYVVLVAYGLMIASILIRHNGCKHYFFCAGWGAAFVIALLGSIAEITSGGGVCPTSGGGGIRGASSGSVPLCFASLAMLIVILVLF